MTTAPKTAERLNRFLARRGVASRRAADVLIAAGRVTLNGSPAPVGARVDPGADEVAVDGRPIAPNAVASTTIALNKPPGVVTTMVDPQGRPTVRGLVPGLPGLVPIGRLDADSRGLLLLTTDGELAHRVAHPRHGVRKTYRVRTAAPLGGRALQRMAEGIELEDGIARVLEHRRVGPGGALVEVVMGEGRKREVRRLLAAVGAEVVDLCRVSVGPIELGGLDEGASRMLTEPELAALHRLVGMGDDQAPAG